MSGTEDLPAIIGGQKSFDWDLVLKIDTAEKFCCSSCSNLLIPDYTLKATCGGLICDDCARDVTACVEHSSHQFEKSIINNSFKKEIGEVLVRCFWCERGCRWIGTFSDLVSHLRHCARGLTTSTKVMAAKYENALFLWSWRGEMINNRPVLSDIRIQSRGMCAFFSITAAFEACLRLKGHRVKCLSVDDLFNNFCAAKAGPDALKGSKLHILATILKEKGIVEVSSDDVPPKRWHISEFKTFDMKTRDGISDAIDHIRDNGPIICVHAVTRYQSDNLESWGIIQGTPSNIDVRQYLKTRNITSRALTTHAVCTVGFGAEDMTSFLSFQNIAGVEVQKDGYGRMLPCSVLEALGLFIDEDSQRPLKRSNDMTDQHYERRSKRAGPSSERELVVHKPS